MSAEGWIALAGLLVTVVTSAIVFAFLYGRLSQRVDSLEKGQDADDKRASDDEQAVLGAIKEVQDETRAGIGYLGAALANEALKAAWYDARLATLERNAGSTGSRPRMPQLRPPPRPPAWLPPSAHVPGATDDTGAHRTYDPSRDPRSR